MQIFSCVNLCDVILAYLEFLPLCNDYMLEKFFLKLTLTGFVLITRFRYIPMHVIDFLSVVSEPKSHDLHAKYYINYNSCNYICY